MNDYIVAIDAGHGSKQYMNGSKQSPDGLLQEGDWAREIVDMIIDGLTDLGIKTYKVTPEKQNVSISERCKRVNNLYKEYNKKVILVSVHVNAAGNGSKWSDANGWSVFVSKNASSNSKQLAKTFTEEAEKLKLMGNRSIPKEKYWTWSWITSDIGILKNTYCPAILTENMFMDNKKDCEFLLSKEGKKKIVDLHIKAITKYLDGKE